MDMHSGGRTKIRGVDYVYIEAPQSEAELLFAKLTKRDPNHVTCDCCGEDYSVSEHATLEEASSYERGGWRGGAVLTPLDIYLVTGPIKVYYARDLPK